MTAIATVTHVDLATVQDGGRRGLAGIGVPISGAWHRSRYLVATNLVRGAEDPRQPAVELLAGSMELHFHLPTTVAVVGPAQVTVDGLPFGAGVGLAVTADVRVVVDHRGPGPVYLAIAGWEAPLVLGSAATDTFSGIAGTSLRSGVALTGVAGSGCSAGAFLRQGDDAGGPLRVVPCEDVPLPVGPWRVQSTARSGTRMVGGAASSSGSRPSRPVVVGAIQAAPSGELIILGPDGGLTGGYPIVGVVCSADLPRVSELEPGEEISLQPMDVPAAMQAFAVAERERRVVHPGVLGRDGSRRGSVPDDVAPAK